MNCELPISLKRPLFLSGARRREIIMQRAAVVASLIALTAFAAGYFFGG